MGEAARRVLRESTTPGERFDIGLELAQRAIEAFLATVEVPEDATPEERARIQFDALREASQR